jgi:hypothetical protein
VITLDDPVPRVAVLGDLREAWLLAHTSLVPVSDAHHGEETGVRTAHHPRSQTVTAAGGAEMVAVRAGAISLTPQVELTDRNSTTVHQPSSLTLSATGAPKTTFEERQTISRHSPRKGI